MAGNNFLQYQGTDGKSDSRQKDKIAGKRISLVVSYTTSFLTT